MNVNLKYYFCFVSIFTFTSMSCLYQAINSEVTKLSDNYSYINKGIITEIGYKNVAYSSKAIGSYILGYEYNEDFILAIQKPHKDYYKSIIKAQVNLIEYETGNKIINLNKLTDSIFNADGYYKNIFKDSINFWIIDITGDSLIGPLSKPEYLSKKISLHVPSNLKLKEEK